MIGYLPKSLTVDGIEYPIQSDFRVVLLIFEAYEDLDITDSEKAEICLKCLYGEENLPKNIQEAYEQAIWFLDGGDIPKSKQQNKKLTDWKQDESILFPAINKVAGTEVRSLDYLHWWTFLGFFSEIGEGLYSQVVNIRSKKSKGKHLEKYEREFYNDHKELVDIKPHYTAEEQAEIDRLKALLD